MGIENASYISELNPFWPLFQDFKKEGAPHIRMLKAAIDGSFPGGLGDLGDTGSWVTGQSLLVLVEDLGAPLMANNLYRDFRTYNSASDLSIGTQWQIYDTEVFTFHQYSQIQHLEIQVEIQMGVGFLPQWIEIGIGTLTNFTTGEEVTTLKRWYLNGPHVGGDTIKTLRGYVQFDPQDFSTENYSNLDEGESFFIAFRADGVSQSELLAKRVQFIGSRS